MAPDLLDDATKKSVGWFCAGLALASLIAAVFTQCGPS